MDAVYPVKCPVVPTKTQAGMIQMLERHLLGCEGMADLEVSAGVCR